MKLLAGWNYDPLPPESSSIVVVLHSVVYKVIGPVTLDVSRIPYNDVEDSFHCKYKQVKNAFKIADRFL